jgi:hypothetical protein
MGGCCGCRSGGTGIAVNKAKKDAWESRLIKTCAETSCAQVMSNDLTCHLSLHCAKRGAGAGTCGFAASTGRP